MKTDTLGMTEEQVGPVNLERLTTIHLKRYRSMLHLALAGEPNLRPKELHAMVVCWENVQNKCYVWDDLPPESRSEIYDAVGSDE